MRKKVKKGYKGFVRRRTTIGESGSEVIDEE